MMMILLMLNYSMHSLFLWMNSQAKQTRRSQSSIIDECMIGISSQASCSLCIICLVKCLNSALWMIWLGIHFLVGPLSLMQRLYVPNQMLCKVRTFPILSGMFAVNVIKHFDMSKLITHKGVPIDIYYQVHNAKDLPKNQQSISTIWPPNCFIKRFFLRPIHCMLFSNNV